ncbi:uncharacterized protein METZ01_LOCUS347923, partial [marine metagenome]
VYQNYAKPQNHRVTTGLWRGKIEDGAILKPIAKQWHKFLRRGKADTLKGSEKLVPANHLD